jgi:hypothetical protein
VSQLNQQARDRGVHDPASSLRLAHTPAPVLDLLRIVGLDAILLSHLALFMRNDSRCSPLREAPQHGGDSNGALRTVAVTIPMPAEFRRCPSR